MSYACAAVVLITKRYRVFTALWCSICFLVAFPQKVRASFTQYYSIDSFTLSNSSSTGNGTAMTPDAGASLVLTGSNDGSGEPGTTDFTILAPISGNVSFDYAFATLDTAGYEFAGYLVNGTFTQLADTDGESGAAQFSVASGDTFGFRVGTVDNTGGPGILTISDFEAPFDSSATPEPSSASFLVEGLCALALVGAAQFARKGGKKL